MWSSLTIQCNPNLASILSFEVLTICLDSRSVGNQKRVPHCPRLSAAVAFGALASVAATTGSKQSSAVSEYRTAPWLIERDPVLHLGAECLETHPRVVLKVLDKLILIKHTHISLVQIVG